MAQKNKLTNRKTPVMVNTMSTTLAKKKTVEKFAGQKTARKLVDVVIEGKEYCIIPRKELEKIMAGKKLMDGGQGVISAGELNRRFEEAMQNNLAFDSVEEAVEYRKNNPNSNTAIGFNKGSDGTKYIRMLNGQEAER